jgi:hypothetical protein
MDLDKIIQRYQLRIEVMPSGTERILHKYGTGIIADLLRKYGFSYNRDGFFRNPRN